MSSLSLDVTIPQKYQDDLEVVEISDHRSDAEILDSLSRYTPVTSEKTIWGFWHAGVNNMPSWCQRNVVDWVRINPGWTVRIIDDVPDSPQYALNYVSRDMLPKAFVERKMDGVYVGPHSADLLRGACLHTYGGVWLDVGAILTRSIDRICWDELEDPNSPYRVSAPLMLGWGIANHFIVARKGDPFIKRWHDLFVRLWSDKTSVDGMINHPLLALSVPTLLAQFKLAAADAWDWTVTPERALEYVTQVIVWWHLCTFEDTGDGFNACEYSQNNIFLFSSVENMPAEAMFGYIGSGQKIMDLLALRRDSDKDSEQYKQAEELVWLLLAKSCMQKVTHGVNLTVAPHLGTLWDLPENKGKDGAPGTFAELLRYGSVHFKQKRESIPRVPAPQPAVTWRKGLFEV